MDSFQEIGPGDSRYDMKTRDIKATVKRMGDMQKKQRTDWETTFGGELEEATMEAVLKGGVNCVGYRSRYARNYDNWIRSLK
jgi:hypothetical protein